MNHEVKDNRTGRDESEWGKEVELIIQTDKAY